MFSAMVRPSDRRPSLKLNSFFTRSKLKYFNFETRLSEIINRVLILAISQFDPILRIRPNLLSSGLISQGSYDGIHSPVVARTTTNIREVCVINKQIMYIAEGSDITVVVSSAPIEVKRTVGPYQRLHYPAM